LVQGAWQLLSGPKIEELMHTGGAHERLKNVPYYSFVFLLFDGFCRNRHQQNANLSFQKSGPTSRTDPNSKYKPTDGLLILGTRWNHQSCVDRGH
jgi:hypothetical protein